MQEKQPESIQKSREETLERTIEAKYAKVAKNQARKYEKNAPSKQVIKQYMQEKQ